MISSPRFNDFVPSKYIFSFPRYTISFPRYNHFPRINWGQPEAYIGAHGPFWTPAVAPPSRPQTAPARRMAGNRRTPWRSARPSEVHCPSGDAGPPPQTLRALGRGKTISPAGFEPLTARPVPGRGPSSSATSPVRAPGRDGSGEPSADPVRRCVPEQGNKSINQSINQ